MAALSPLRRWPYHPLVAGRAWRCGVLGCFRRHSWLGAWLHRLFHDEYTEGLS